MSTLEAWLETQGLGKYTAIFVEQEIDLEALRLLSDLDLQELGLPLGPRRKLREAIAQMDGRRWPASQAAPPQPSVSAERRQLTVMFCDLVGSTALTQELDPEKLRELMRAYQQTCAAVIERYDGHLAQYLGDGLMIYFGWPRAHEDDAERALRAALDMVSAVKKVDAPSPLRVHIGIATGAVVVGESSNAEPGGSELAVGETPNLAARLQAMAGPDEIVVGPSTQRLAGGQFDYESLGQQTFKGILQPVHAYRVKGILRVEGRFDASHTRQLTPLVGRASEVALLLDRWERAKNGEGQGVLLSAEPGIGKSRITRALRERIAAEPHLSLHYQCSPFHSNSAFYPVIEQFERAARFSHDDSPRQKIAKMETLLHKGRTKVAEAAPLYAAMLSLPTDAYPAEQLSPQQQKERTIAAQISQVVGLAAQQPVIMVLEDAHWADPSTLEVFAGLLERIEPIRVLLVITYRPEFNAPWLGHSRVTALRLSRLSRKETASLAEQVSGKPLPAEVLDQILDKTDGVPLFVEELTKAVLESGLLHDAGDHYIVPGALPPLAIPSTLHDSLMARLDRLAPVRDLIQLGAVIGREFAHKMLAMLTPLSGTQLEAALEQLVVSELVYRRGAESDAVYVFKHALVQEVAYESILHSRRRQLHARVATILEGEAQLAQSDPGFLALQFDRAGLIEKAVEWYMRAGHNANLRSATREALHHFQRALALLDERSEDAQTTEQRVDLNTEIGLLHMAIEGWASNRAREHFAEAERLNRNSRSERRFRTLVGMITTLTWYGYSKVARDYSEELIALARETGARVHRLYAQEVYAQCLMYEGKFQQGLREAQQALALSDAAADEPLAFRYGHDAKMVSLWWSAYMQWETGALDQSLYCADQGLLHGRRIGHAFSLACSLTWTLDLSYFMWLPERILQHAQEAVAVAQRHGFQQLEAMASFHHGWARAQSGHNRTSHDGATRFGLRAGGQGRGGAVRPGIFSGPHTRPQARTLPGDQPGRGRTASAEGGTRRRARRAILPGGDRNRDRGRCEVEAPARRYLAGGTMAAARQDRRSRGAAPTSIRKFHRGMGHAGHEER
jgi:class 3 adenylate cyclase